MIISFAWTTPALLAGAKTMTRREWNDDYAARFKAGQLVDAWNRSPRTGRSSGARKVATIRLTKAPYLEDTAHLTRDDYEREGFAWLMKHGEIDDQARVQQIWIPWVDQPRFLWVVEFELIDITTAAAAAPSLGSGDAAAATSSIGAGLRLQSAGGRPLEGETGAEHLSSRRGDHART